ncbi:hypothetical protein LXL04_034021 [Taraxacum kok-saghyz]
MSCASSPLLAKHLSERYPRDAPATVFSGKLFRFGKSTKNSLFLSNGDSCYFGPIHEKMIKPLQNQLQNLPAHHLLSFDFPPDNFAYLDPKPSRFDHFPAKTNVALYPVLFSSAACKIRICQIDQTPIFKETEDTKVLVEGRPIEVFSSCLFIRPTNLKQRNLNTDGEDYGDWNFRAEKEISETGLAPEVTLRRPSLMISRARTDAVVVPSPAESSIRIKERVSNLSDKSSTSVFHGVRKLNSSGDCNSIVDNLWGTVFIQNNIHP